MASAKSELSQTLQDITHAKLRELSRKQEIFLSHKATTLQTVQALDSKIERLAALSNGLKTCFGIPVVNGRMIRGHTSNHERLEITLANIDRFLKQQSLLSNLEMQTLKYEFATLFGQLTMEWLSTKKGPPPDDDVSMSEEPEQLPGAEKLESRKQWEDAVFTPLELDTDEIELLLSELFQNPSKDAKDIRVAFKELQRKVQVFEESLTYSRLFSASTLRWTISGLMASDLLTEEKRTVLKDFLNNAIILDELSDVLNMRMTALDAWSWGTEVPIEQRRQLNGTYNIYMHEDLIQAIFLQYLGVKWSVFFKSAFTEFRKASGVWKSPGSNIPEIDKSRREFFLGYRSPKHSVQSTREKIYQKGSRGAAVFFEEEAGVDEGEDSDDDYDTDNGREVFNPKNPMDAKQNLLHLLATDILIKTQLEGELTCFRSKYDSLNPDLSHATIHAVLGFFGVSEKWLGFFQRFLKAPLKFIDDPHAEPRQRQRGTPGAHVLSDVFGESILFCLDFMINQKTEGELLWRVHDDFWFWSSNHQTCVTAWNAIQRFNKTMGISLDPLKTGTAQVQHKATKSPTSLDPALPPGQVRWGMLYLNPDSGHFEIDQQMVDSHVEELNRQLKDQVRSVFGWIQAWNSYATTFFTSNFGKPANCFGRKHVDMMLATHERIQRVVFSLDAEGGKSDVSVIQFLRDIICQRFNITSVPDGYFFLPIELGGLELSSPFIQLVGLRDSLIEDPTTLLDKFLEAERDAYASAKVRYEQRLNSTQHAAIHNQGFYPDDAHTFISFEEYIRYRELLGYGFTGELKEVYEKLLQRPEQQHIECDPNGAVFRELNQLSGHQNLRGIKSNWRNMDAYWKWVAELYGQEIIDRFGGFNIVDPGLLPIGMVSLFRSGRIQWQE
ncbi:hypothetical protein AO1008_11318 [Aspergillus oryzae 100-8]|uniref:Reverse transcriptase domain-containing protein n=1 Tax=Aspergillus oryzae (strain 3.042) TaxID=1160506 RepID=I8U074_ASPO3|nr:hypothetical protein Ao3042_03599 [Aspergillus oryzae 3.042]KDE84678.1 hypothetical protein AO1008_11318 [Aspergillus oryzae 100-8]|eukprot:EIT79973.1 hypothetical protein Ao3042_03599 [Aspergillus oryzae 3.042]